MQTQNNKLLHRACNESWGDHVTNLDLNITVRQLRLMRHTETLNQVTSPPYACGHLEKTSLTHDIERHDREGHQS